MFLLWTMGKRSSNNGLRKHVEKEMGKFKNGLLQFFKMVRKVRDEI